MGLVNKFNYVFLHLCTLSLLGDTETRLLTCVNRFHLEFNYKIWNKMTYI